MILLVNKDYLFNKEMLEDLQIIPYELEDDKIIYVESETLKHFEMLKAHLKVEGITIEIDEAYRSLEKQETIFLDAMKKNGLEEASKLVDMPGTSEHHTGQAIDFKLKKNNKWLKKEELLKYPKELKKIFNSLKYFGFILRYPKNKENITNIKYKPWHIRYVGKEVNKIGNKTLEEYLLK